MSIDIEYLKARFGTLSNAELAVEMAKIKKIKDAIKENIDEKKEEIKELQEVKKYFKSTNFS